MYYITRKNSETGKKMQELLDKASAIRKEISEYLKLVGANPNQWVSSDNYFFNTGVIAVFFDKEPDLKIWREFKKIPNCYQPRMTSYEGKKIQSKFQSIGEIDRVDLNEVVGFNMARGEKYVNSTDGIAVFAKRKAGGTSVESVRVAEDS